MLNTSIGTLQINYIIIFARTNCELCFFGAGIGENMREYIAIHKNVDGETQVNIIAEDKIKLWMGDGSLEKGDRLYLITKRYEIISELSMVETKIKVVKQAPK